MTELAFECDADGEDGANPRRSLAFIWFPRRTRHLNTLMCRFTSCSTASMPDVVCVPAITRYWRRASALVLRRPRPSRVPALKPVVPSIHVRLMGFWRGWLMR